MSESDSAGQLQDYSVDQAAGAVVLVLGAVASLLLVIWQSRCFCSVNLCYIFRCERRPPNESEMEGLKDQAAKLKNKKTASREKASGYKPPKSEVEYKEKKMNEEYHKQLNPTAKATDEEDPYLSVEETEPQPQPDNPPRSAEPQSAVN